MFKAVMSIMICVSVSSCVLAHLDENISSKEMAAFIAGAHKIEDKQTKARVLEALKKIQQRENQARSTT